MNVHNHQNDMIKVAVQEHVALNMALKGLLEIDTMLTKSIPESTSITKKKPFIQFLKNLRDYWLYF
ncbi:hypothetical protein [Maribacter luteus]|uniref:hypothetical protein n=1 Tax=Maribacter luteus TaxID=2594478 RepID=UPI002492C6C9|nr:hypothetical protein [Maribacter luteus]